MLVTDKQYYMEKALVEKLDLMIKRMHGKGTDDNVILIDGDEGCLTGDTMIATRREDKQRKFSLKYLYNALHENPERIKWLKGFNVSIPTYVKSFNGVKLIWHLIKDVTYSGKKEVFLLTLSTGKSIKATATHKFLAPRPAGWTELKDLKAGTDYIKVSNFSVHPIFELITSIVPIGIQDTYDIECEAPHHNFLANDIIAHNSGKTNLEYAVAYYIADKTGRELRLEKNLFFDLDALITFAINTKDQIILFDEGALGGLASEWWQKNQVKFLKLLMVCRKKRHFFVICIPKFFKLNEYLVVDRSISLIHVYAKQNLVKGYFFYFTKRKKEKLYYDWKKTHRRNYAGFKSIRGTFGITEDFLFDSVAYNLKKDEAIMNLDKKPLLGKKELRENEQMEKLKLGIARLIKYYDIDRREASELLDFTPRTISDWAKLGLREAKPLGNQDLEGFERPSLPYTGGGSQDLMDNAQKVLTIASNLLANDTKTGIEAPKTGVQEPEAGIGEPDKALNEPSDKPVN